MLPKKNWNEEELKTASEQQNLFFGVIFMTVGWMSFFFVCEIIALKKSYTCSLSYGQDARRKKRDIGRSLWIGISSIQMSECCLLYIVEFGSNDVVEFIFCPSRKPCDGMTKYISAVNAVTLTTKLLNTPRLLYYALDASIKINMREEGKIESPQNCQRARLTAIKRVDIRLAELNSNLIAA